MRASRGIAVGGAALAIQPGAAQLRAARRVVATPLAMSLAGGAIQFEHVPAPGGNSYEMSVAPTALAITSGNVAMRVSRRLGVSAGAPTEMVISPGAAGLRVQRRVPVQAASFEIEGRAVRFDYTGSGGAIDASKVPAARTVVFGGGKRSVIFSGGVRVVTFAGGTRIVRF